MGAWLALVDSDWQAKKGNRFAPLEVSFLRRASDICVELFGVFVEKFRSLNYLFSLLIRQNTKHELNAFTLSCHSLLL